VKRTLHGGAVEYSRAVEHGRAIKRGRAAEHGRAPKHDSRKRSLVMITLFIKLMVSSNVLILNYIK
jgi:hypothetical protein